LKDVYDLSIARAPTHDSSISTMPGNDTDHFIGDNLPPTSIPLASQPYHDLNFSYQEPSPPRATRRGRTVRLPARFLD